MIDFNYFNLVSRCTYCIFRNSTLFFFIISSKSINAAHSFAGHLHNLQFSKNLKMFHLLLL